MLTSNSSDLDLEYKLHNMYSGPIYLSHFGFGPEQERALKGRVKRFSFRSFIIMPLLGSSKLPKYQEGPQSNIQPLRFKAHITAQLFRNPNCKMHKWNLYGIDTLSCVRYSERSVPCSCANAQQLYLTPAKFNNIVIQNHILCRCIHIHSQSYDNSNHHHKFTFRPLLCSAAYSKREPHFTQVD